MYRLLRSPKGRVEVRQGFDEHLQRHERATTRTEVARERHASGKSQAVVEGFAERFERVKPSPRRLLLLLISGRQFLQLNSQQLGFVRRARVEFARGFRQQLAHGGVNVRKPFRSKSVNVQMSPRRRPKCR